jgi:DNA-binding winged helix-turn-helix (wHTH) protein/tetratricopeptide (TPR) repeat protein
MVAKSAHRTIDPIIRLRVFGPVEMLSFSGESVLPRGRKAQAILCYLALTPDTFVPRQRLISLLWSSRWTEQGRASLRQSLLELRSALRSGNIDVLSVQRDRIGLDRDKIWIDGLTRRAEEDEATSEGALHAERLLETLVGLQIGPRAIDDYVAPALTQEIVSALARLRWLRIRFSTERGGADYLLDGYVSVANGGFRLVLRLLDHTDREIILWTGTIQLPCPLQASSIGEAVEQVVEQLDPEILAIETRKALRRPPATDDSYDCLLRAVPLLYRFEQCAWREATNLLDRARRLDPQHGRALAFSALCRVTALAQGWSESPADDMRAADREAAHAIACDPRDSLALALSGHIKSFIQHEFDTALSLFERAIHANPSCGLSWGYSSLTYAYLGRTAEASRRLARAQAIMIHDPYLSFMESFAAVIAFFAHDWGEAVRLSRRQLEMRPGFVAMRKLLIGALCQTGRFDEACGEDRLLRSEEAGFAWTKHLRAYPFGREEDRASLEAALRRARLLPDPIQPAARAIHDDGTPEPLPRLRA